jgi:type IV secretion system protein VirB8
MSDRLAYFERAGSWAADARADSARSRKIAWTVAGVAVAAALFQAVALALMVPLKTVQPVTLLVDRHTGYVQALDPLTPKRVAADDALTQSYLAQYVSARESFDRATVAHDYKRVALWSGGRARSAYLGYMPATNPESPLRLYAPGTVVTVQVKSVSRLQPGVALVRFDTRVLDRSGAAGQPQPWISVVRFHYTDAPMRIEDRLVNPLGFQVTGYRRDSEAPPAEPAQLVAGPAATAAVPASSVMRPPATAMIEVQASGASAVRARPSPSSTRPVSVANPPLLPTRGQSAVGPIERREVPINSLPLGSPLSPTNAPVSLADLGDRP